MNNLQVIDEREVLGKDFKIYGDIDNPLFLAKDVAEWIGIDASKNTGQMLNNVDKDEKIISPLKYKGQMREMWFLTEDGLYEVLMQSKKPIAKQFKKEVKSILKKLRRGEISIQYNKKEQLLIQLFSKNPLDVANAHKELVAIETAPLLETIKEQAPKVETYDLFMDYNHTLPFRALRKELESALEISIKENHLKDVMRSLGIIGKSATKALEYAIRNGYAVTKDVSCVNGYTGTQDRFTMKCRDLLVEHFEINLI